MRILIYSDVHGNLLAFQKVLKDAGFCDQYICLGDLVNYGPWSNECVDLALSLKNSIILKGNHEDAFINGFYPGSNKLVQQFFDVCMQDFKYYQEIKSFRHNYLLDSYTLTHTINDLYIYPDTQVELNGDYMIGHSHHQFRYENNGYVLFNTGSVGQNRKYINLASYILYDLDSKVISMKNVEYDFDSLISEMKKRDYPEACIDYYLNKEKFK